MDSVLSAREATAVAEAYATETTRLATQVRSLPRLGALADQFRARVHNELRLTEYERLAAGQQFGMDVVDHVGLVVWTAEAVRLWRKTNVIYRVHPELATSLMDSETNASIPCEVFAHLPHPDPFVVFPRPVSAPPVESALPMRDEPMVTGMLITGLTQQQTMCSTADSRLSQLNVALTVKLHYVDEPLPTYEERSVVIPLSGTQSVQEMSNSFRVSETGDYEAYQLAVTLLLYLCSDRQDMKASQHRPSKVKKGHKGVSASSTVVDVGFDIGPKLFAARQEQDEPGRGQPLTQTRAKRSHLRRAHWHTYWTGPRNSQSPIVRWLHPILVHPQDRPEDRPLVIDADPTFEIRAEPSS